MTLPARPDVSVVVLNWNTRDLLAECLRITQACADGLTLELIVVDNASTDDSVALVRRDFPQVRVIESPANVGFAAGNNLGAQQASGRYILLLNTDAFLKPGALGAMAALLDAQPRAGLCGARLLNRDGSFQASHTPFPTVSREFLILSGLGRLFMGRHYPSRGPEREAGPRPVDYVEGACLLCRPEAYRQVGGLDPGFFMYAEEVDLCMALKRAGWSVWYHPEAEVVHLGGASSSLRRPEREGDLYVSRVRFFRKHYGPVAATLLTGLIYLFTAAKNVLHTGLRLATGGRKGRPVVSLSRLAAKLRAARA
ncbi:MAG: glycosyltransferase family 2 protein [Anaerolineales bacterium]|nr:glycosyltransferase family 2 protein [Anaerolineales bacterium]